MDIQKSHPASPFRPQFEGKINSGKFEPTGDLDLNNCYSQSTITMDIGQAPAGLPITRLVKILNFSCKSY